MLKGPVWSRSWAIFRTDQGPDQSHKFLEPKNRGLGLQKTAKNRSEPVCNGPGLNILKSGLNPQKHQIYCENKL